MAHSTPTKDAHPAYSLSQRRMGRVEYKSINRQVAVCLAYGSFARMATAFQCHAEPPLCEPGNSPSRYATNELVSSM